MQTNENDLDLSELMDITLDDLADMPEFKAYPPGAHRAKLNLSYKKVNEKPTVEAGFTYIGLVELVNSQDEAPKEGDTCNVLCQMDNEFGQGTFKMIMAATMVPLGTTNAGATIEACQEVEVMIITSLQKNKNDADSPYMKLKAIEVV